MSDTEDLNKVIDKLACRSYTVEDVHRASDQLNDHTRLMADDMVQAMLDYYRQPLPEWMRGPDVPSPKMTLRRRFRLWRMDRWDRLHDLMFHDLDAEDDW